VFENVLTASAAQPQGGGIDFMTIALFVIFGLLIFMMFRKQKKAQAQMREKAEALQEKMHPGAQVMTAFGLYGTVVSVDRDENKVVIELSPGNTATVHTQAVNEVVDTESPAVPDDASALTGESSGSTAASEPAEDPLNRLDEENNKDNK
jgi:preprotein translocase subunit YajC